MIHPKLLKQFLVEPGSEVDLKDHLTDITQTDEAKEYGKEFIKERAAEILEESQKQLCDAQELLYASDTHSVLIILQAMDAAGKDGTIRHVMSGVNPQGCQVFSFKKPSAEELDHNFLWRYMKALPERGRIGIFNRSYYEDVLVVRVHPELVGRLPGSDRAKDFWQGRYDDINAFEQHLTRSGTLVLKFLLNVSKKVQRQRFLERLERPEKHWKFSISDLEERKYWSDYQKAFEQMLQNTSTDHAPWWVIPADNKWVTRTLVAGIITRSIEGMGLEFPTVSDKDRERLEAARIELSAGK